MTALLIGLMAVSAAEGQLNFSELKIGDVGEFKPNVVFKSSGGVEGYYSFRVLQVLDENRVLIDVLYGYRGFRDRSYSQRHSSIILVETNTKNLVDDRPFEPEGLFKVSGKYTYQTSGGSSKTVFKVSRLSDEEVAKIEAARAAEKFAKRWKAEARVWTDRSGRFQVEAMYDGFEPGHVWLKKEDGSRVKVPLSKLANDDRLRAIDIARERGDFN